MPLRLEWEEMSKDTANRVASPSSPVRALRWLFLFTIRKYPRQTTFYYFLEVIALALQFMAMGATALAIQKSMSGSFDLFSNQFFVDTLGADRLSQLQNIGFNQLLFFLAVTLALNAVFSYAASRRLTRIAMLLEQGLSVNVIESMTKLSLRTYRKFSAGQDFDHRIVIRYIQQNSRLAAIAGRNLVSSLYAGFLLLVVFGVLTVLEPKVAGIAFVAIIVVGLAMGFVFRLGMVHSAAFPNSVPASTKARMALLDRALLDTKKSNESIESDYLSNTDISDNLRLYEERYKIIDIGGLITTLLISFAFIYIIKFIGDSPDDLGQALNPGVIVLILFVGNLLWQALRRISGLFVAMGRVYEQVSELWQFNTHFIASAQEVAKHSEHESKQLTQKSIVGKIKPEYANQNGDGLPLRFQGVLAICQQQSIDRLAIFKALDQSVDLPKINESFFDGIIVVDEKLLDQFIDEGESDTKLRFEFLSLVDKSAAKDQEVDTDNSDAFALFAAMRNVKGPMVVPLEMLASIPAPVFAILHETFKPDFILACGRAPKPGLIGYEEIIDQTLLIGRNVKVVSTKDALEISGPDLQSLLRVSNTGDFDAFSDLELF